MPIYQLGDKKPVIPASCYIAPEAVLIGEVTLGENVSIMSGAVLRADNEPITLGQGSNIQENSVLHVDEGLPLIIGENVTVGHQVMLHGCVIGDGSLIGIQAVVLNGAKQVELRCGQASIVLTAAGKILIKGTYVMSRSSGANRIKGAFVDIN